MGDDVQDLGVGRMFWTMWGGADCSLGVLIRGRQRGLGRYRREKARGQQRRDCVRRSRGAPESGKGERRSRGAPESEKGETDSSLNL